MNAGEDLSVASLDALDSNTEVVVTIKEKPVVTIPSGISNGTLTVIYKDAANKDISVSNGDHIPNGTQLLVTLTPDTNYIVDDEQLGSIKAEYVDGTGKTTDAKSYTIDNVTTNVDVTTGMKNAGKIFKEKPIVTIPSVVNGTIKVSYLDDDSKEVIVKDKDHVDIGTNLTVALTPEKGYVVDEDALGTSVETEYTDEDKSGNTTDTKSYKVENVIANVTVKGAFKALRTHKVTYEPVIAAGESANGTLTAKADRKQIVKEQTISKEKIPDAMEDFMRDIPEWKQWKKRLFFIKERAFLLPEHCPDLRGLRIVRSGLYLGDCLKKRFEPSQALAMALHLSGYKKSISFPAEDIRVEKYLRGETVDMDDSELSGWTLFCVDEFPLGWGKCNRGRLKNKYNPGWRKL